MSAIPTKITQKAFDDHVRPHLSTARRGFECKIPLFKVFNYILYWLHTGCQLACALQQARLLASDEMLASYACSYDQKTYQIKKLGESTLYENHFSHQQPQLLQIAPEQWQRITRRDKGQRQRVTLDPTQRRLPGIAVQK